jgi:hypothetical protein
LKKIFREKKEGSGTINKIVKKIIRLHFNSAIKRHYIGIIINAKKKVVFRKQIKYYIKK